MGYTHRWQVVDYPTDPQWREITRQTRKILKAAKACGLKLAKECDDPKRAPVVTRTFIRFNGVGDQGYETFWINRTDREWNFCKTGPWDARPYDPVVVSVLVEIKRILGEGFRLSSDGGPAALVARYEITGPEVR